MGYTGKNFPERMTYSFLEGTKDRIEAAAMADGLGSLAWIRQVVYRALVDSEMRRGVYSESTD